MKSQFVDDAKLPLTPQDVEWQPGFPVPIACYGAADVATPLQAGKASKPEMAIIKAVRSRAGSYFEEDCDDDDDDDFDDEFESGMFSTQPEQPSLPPAYIDISKLRHVGDGEDGDWQDGHQDLLGQYEHYEQYQPNEQYAQDQDARADLEERELEGSAEQVAEALHRQEAQQ